MCHSTIRPVKKNAIELRLNINNRSFVRHENPLLTPVSAIVVVMVTEVFYTQQTSVVVWVVDVDCKPEAVFGEMRDLEVGVAVDVRLIGEVEGGDECIE